jgi:excisionase family DNA binding protein
MTILEKPAPPPGTQTSISALLIDQATMAPLGVKPKEAARLIGGSRSEVYRLLRQCRLRAVKRGTSLLVLTDSIYEHMASLPPATFGADRVDHPSRT